MMVTQMCHALPEPYNSIEVLPFDPHGWFNGAHQLTRLMKGKEFETIVEVGCWLGSSTRFLADKVTAGGKVYAVDTWLGSDEAAHTQNPRLPYLYQQFLSNVIHTELCDKIIPVRMTSVAAAKKLDVEADLIHLDGAHDYQSVKDDILSWFPHLKKGGIMCGDDWQWGSVQQAVVECANILNVTVSSDANFWYYE